ncbi:MAG TPA: IS110 family transposase [Smithellaceae bacterium]|nr:IS110 family transposase [Smithellaceae bacterium]HRS89502.1 IS110 family transposase [Smithellaceae bacterium]HRV26451.1 IS110 family transposase [Smithellaceae bacterium]
MKYIGIDYHKQYFVATMMNEQGQVIRRDKASTDRESIRQYFRNADSSGKVKAVMEACYGWEYFYDEASALVDELIMAHPLKTRLIAEARIKTDTIDSETLAHLLRADLIPQAYAPDSETRSKKNLLRYRSSLVAMKVRIKNIIHSVLTRNHIEDIGFTSLSDKFGKQGIAYLKAVTLRDNDTAILNDYLDLLEKTEQKIKEAEKRIRAVCREDKICTLLQSIPGIGPILAATIRYEIDDIGRFMSAGKLCSYAGLVPSTYSSGNRTFQGKITKQGNKWLRWAMVEAAQQSYSQ